jgi:hypothetical protein
LWIKGTVHVLQHLEHWFSSVLGSKEFLAAIFGAIVGGIFVVVAQLISNRAQRRRDREAESEAVKSVLRAIKAELKTFNEKALVRLEKIFEARENSIDVQKPLAIAPLKQNYFIVFDSNAARDDRKPQRFCGRNPSIGCETSNQCDKLGRPNRKIREPLNAPPAF